MTTAHDLAERTGGRRAVGPADAGPSGLPLTAAQAALWDVRTGAAPAANTAECLEIHGHLDPVLFAEALHRTVGEADALRVRLVNTPDGPRQLPIAVEAPGHGFPLYAADLRDQGDPDATAHAWMRADLDTPFDPRTGPLFAHALFRVGERRWLWYQRVHGAVLDGYGYCLVARRAAEIYTTLTEGGTPGPSPFGRLAGLVAEDTLYRASEAYERDRAYWRRKLTDFRGAPTPAGRTAPASPTALRRTARLDGRTSERLRDLAGAVRATWTDVVLAAQAYDLARATGASDVVLGVPMMGRTASSALRVPGMVRTVLPLRLTVGRDTTFAELTHQAAQSVRAARRHQRYRQEDIRRDLGLPAGVPLVGPVVNVVPFNSGLLFGQAPSRALSLAPGPVDDLTVTLHDRADSTGLRVDHEANPALYGEDELATHQERFVELLARVADWDPHRALAELPGRTE
ncbi:condensation domain-containing protein [Streptomyces gamaensis]|uniref:Condensation domain-containing protein n=1 Tax=Streptomyces gamaensis TaxID=1763542 RepID=A0ABW0YUW8_9ACTN